MTVSEGHPAKRDDPQASLRTELVGQLAAAQLALETAIAELSRTGGDVATLSASRAQLSSLVGLRQQITFASGPALASLRAEALAASSSASALAQQAGDSASNNAGAGNSNPAQAARRAIEEVGQDLFERRKLDPYLKFTSAEDEEEYRKREEQRNEERNRALELHTTEGDRLALKIQREQWRDAGEHGAASSPEYRAMGEKMAQAEKDLDLSEARTGNRDAPSTRESTAKGPAQPKDDMADILATLKAAGVQTTEPAKSDGHGLAAGARGPAGQGTQIG